VNIIDPRRLDYKMPVTENKPVSNEPNYYRSLYEREETNKDLDKCSVGQSYNQHSENLFPDTAGAGNSGIIEDNKHVPVSTDRNIQRLATEESSFGEVSGRRPHHSDLQSIESVCSKKSDHSFSKQHLGIAARVTNAREIEDKEQVTFKTFQNMQLWEDKIQHCEEIDDLDPSEILLSKVNVFNRPSCSEIKLYKKYIIMLEGENLKKLDRNDLNVLKSVKMCDVRRLCKIHDHSVGVLRINKCISIVDCETLETKYKIITSKPYAEICRIRTFIKVPQDIPDQHYVFVAAYIDTSSCSEDKIDIVMAKPGRIQNIIPQYGNKVVPLNLRRTNFRGISAIASLTTSKVIVGFSYDVECIEFDECFKTKTLWYISLKKSVTDIYCSKKFVFLCIKDEHRLALLCPENGKEIARNILPDNVKMSPDRLSIHGDSILVKEFSYNDWSNVSTDCKIFQLKH
jgi:hypothetical protein